jgi:nitrogen fixation NifU-like protein
VIGEHFQIIPLNSDILEEHGVTAPILDQATILSMYSSQILDHFEHPRNAGEIANPDAKARVENPACGDILELSLKMQDGRIGEIRFRAKGCVPAMACGSALTELVREKTLQEARQLTREEVVAAVGGLPEASSHASYLAMDALVSVLNKLITW